MTTQIQDSVSFDGHDWALAGVAGWDGWFHPGTHGITVVAATSACWRGFHCHFEVADGALRMRELNVWVEAGVTLPQLAGASPKNFGDRGYHYALTLPLAYSGWILLRRHTFLWPISRELTFLEGRLASVRKVGWSAGARQNA